MLIQKLLRIDEATVQEVEKLAQKLSEKEYTSFSALARTLIKKGLNTMETNENSSTAISFKSKVENMANSAAYKEAKILAEVKEQIEECASYGQRKLGMSLGDFARYVYLALGKEVSVQQYLHFLYKILAILHNENFHITIVDGNDWKNNLMCNIIDVYVEINW